MKPTDKISDALHRITPLELAGIRQALRDHANQIKFFINRLDVVLTSARIGSDREFLAHIKEVVVLAEEAEPILDKLSLQQSYLRTIPIPTPTVPEMSTMPFAKPPLKRGVGVRTISKSTKKNVTSQQQLADTFDFTPQSRPTRQPEKRHNAMWPDEELDDDIPF